MEKKNTKEFFIKLLLKPYIYLFIIAVLLIIYLFQENIRITDTAIVGKNGNVQAVKLPYSAEASQIDYVIKGIIHYDPFFSPDVLHITAGGIMVIKLNGNNLPLEDYSRDILFNKENGSQYNIGRYLRSGENEFEFTIKNPGGQTGLKIERSTSDLKFIVPIFLLLFIAAYLFFSLFKRRSKDNVILWILISGILIRVLYLLVTPFDVRSYDPGGHIGYIEYIAAHFWLPPANLGPETYQPPLYYILSAVIYKISALFTADKYAAYFILQCFSLLISIGFMIVSYLFIKKVFQNNPFENNKASDILPGRQGKIISYSKSSLRLMLILSSLLAAFWPSSIIHSVRIGNDCLFYLLFAVSLYYLFSWNNSKKVKEIYLSVLFAVLTLITKDSGFLLFIIIAITYIYHFFRDRQYASYLKTALFLGLIFIAGFAVTFGNRVIGGIRGEKINATVPGSGGLKSEEVGNSARNYLFFNISDFINEPYVYPLEDRGGRQYFWNYLLKTSLAGEFKFINPVSVNMAALMSYFYLWMIVYMLGGLLLMDYKKLLFNGVMLVNLFVLLSGAALFRISMPASGSNDFRLILPVLISFIYLFTFSISEYKKRGWKKLEYAGYGMGLLFSMFSAVFFISLLF